MSKIGISAVHSQTAALALLRESGVLSFSSLCFAYCSCRLGQETWAQHLGPFHRQAQNGHVSTQRTDSTRPTWLVCKNIYQAAEEEPHSNVDSTVHRKPYQNSAQQVEQLPLESVSLTVLLPISSEWRWGLPLVSQAYLHSAHSSPNAALIRWLDEWCTVGSLREPGHPFLCSHNIRQKGWRERGWGQGKRYLEWQFADSKINDPAHNCLEWRGLLIRHPGPLLHLAAIDINRSSVDSSGQLMSGPC